jgi:hypothetical protein
MGSEVILFGTTPQLTITAGVPGPDQRFPTEELVNRFNNEAIEITELIFELHSSITSSGNVGAADSVRSAQISLSIGRYLITDRSPFDTIAIIREATVGNVVALAAAALDTLQVRRWILARPLMVHPLESFSGLLSYDGAAIAGIATGTVDLTVVARGRRGGKIDRTRCVPYASGYLFRTPTAPAPNLVFQNTFNSPLFIRSINTTLGSSIQTAPGQTPPVITAPGGLANVVRRDMVPQLTTPWGLAGQRKSLEVAHQLNPREFYQITTALRLDDAIPSALVAPAITISGYREESR